MWESVNSYKSRPSTSAAAVVDGVGVAVDRKEIGVVDGQEDGTR